MEPLQLAGDDLKGSNLSLQERRCDSFCGFFRCHQPEKLPGACLQASHRGLKFRLAEGVLQQKDMVSTLLNNVSRGVDLVGQD